MESPDSRQGAIISMFDGLARHYDLMNGLMTFGRHQAWRIRAAGAAGVRPGARVLDLCCGTGDFMRAFADRAGPQGLVCGLDYSWDMLAAGRDKLRRVKGARLEQLRGDARQLPFSAGMFDAVCIGFGIRNVVSPPRCLEEIHRVLRPGGRVVVLEAGRPRNALLRRAYLCYASLLTPALARALSTNPAAYGNYLPDTIMKFPARGEFTALLQNAGFADAVWQSLNFGTVYIYSGTK